MALSQFLPLMALLPSVDGEGVFKVFAIAGIGGLALAVFYRLFRELIRKLVFPKLKREDAYKIIIRFMMLVFLIAVLGIAAWIFKRDPTKAERSSAPAPAITPVPQVTIYGWVVHGDNKAESPVAGVNVGIHTGPSTTTVDNGDFQLAGIPSRLQAPETAELYVRGWYVLQPAMVSRGQFVISGAAQNIKVIVARQNELLSPKAVETPVGQRVYCFDYRRKTTAVCPHPSSSKGEWHSFLEQKAQEINVPTEKLEIAINKAMLTWMSKDSSPYQQGLAALYRNDYRAAAELFKLATTSKDSSEALQARIAAAYSEYREQRYLEAEKLLDALTAQHLDIPIFRDARNAVESHDSPKAPATVSESDIIEAAKKDKRDVGGGVLQLPCENQDKRAEKLCLIVKNILVDHDRKLLDATLTNAVSRDAANAMFDLLVSTNNCSPNVEIHKVKWANYTGGYVALGHCDLVSPRLWALFDEKDLTIVRIGSGDFVSMRLKSVVEETAKGYADELFKQNIRGFRSHFIAGLSDRDSLETVSKRVSDLTNAAGHYIGIAGATKDPYTDVVLVTGGFEWPLVLELDLDPSLNIRDWYLRRDDEPRHIPQKFQDVQ